MGLTPHTHTPPLHSVLMDLYRSGQAQEGGVTLTDDSTRSQQISQPVLNKSPSNNSSLPDKHHS